MLIVSSVMFTFISYWRTAAIVLSDLASTAYYIGGIVEGAIGPAAPWFILGVMLFSYAVRSIYIESCSLFVRGGVYRVVKEAMGGFLAKLSVSALMFDYVLTGPISAVSAGQYIVGLVLEGAAMINPHLAAGPDTAAQISRWGSVVIACAITLYFFRQNILGIHESSGKALKIMIATTIMAVVMFVWCGLTLCLEGPKNSVPLMPDLRPRVETITNDQGKTIEQPKINEATGEQEDPLGFISKLFPATAERLREPAHWWGIIGVIGLLLAFGHSILAMSGEETLAQVYREVESPKLRNFKKAAFIVFVYSLVFTAGISFLAVMMIPDGVRMKDYSDNLIGGLAMNVVGPPAAKLFLRAFVVIVGFLILAGAVNTAIIGSNGVLNRVAEDGVMPDWFLKPHRRYGTTSRLLTLIVGLQLFVVIASRGNMYILGEAYAFGVVWSFVFKAAAMVVLRFKDRSSREFKVPLNVRVGGVEYPIGLTIIFLILLATALLNLLTKEVATVGGAAFTAIFLAIFVASEHYHEKRRGAAAHKHLEQFNQKTADEVRSTTLGLSRPFCKLVAIRSTQNLFMLERTLAETDPDTTDVVVMTAHVTQRGGEGMPAMALDHYDRELMTAVVDRAEKAGKQVHPMILRTNNPLFAVVNTAADIRAHELIMGVSNVYSADEQIEQIAFYWINIHGGEPTPLTVRLLSPSRDVYFDLAGGNRIPKLGERRARSVAELRAAGVGVRHVLLAHYGTPESSDLFFDVLTMLDPHVVLTVVPVLGAVSTASGASPLEQVLERARQLKREVECHPTLQGDPTQAVAALAGRLRCDLLIVGATEETPSIRPPLNYRDLARQSPCPVCFVSLPPVPHDVSE